MNDIIARISPLHEVMYYTVVDNEHNRVTISQLSIIDIHMLCLEFTIVAIGQSTCIKILCSRMGLVLNFNGVP